MYTKLSIPRTHIFGTEMVARPDLLKQNLENHFLTKIAHSMLAKCGINLATFMLNFC